MNQLTDLSITTLQQAYASSQLSPESVIEQILDKIEHSRDENVWISVQSRAQLENYLQALQRKTASELPLYGIPFAVKDNIDLVDLPTTAACPSFSYQPQKSAFVVQTLIDAGAIPIGKTNLDQFATGLVGTRSPYGVVNNSFESTFIAGGSSSGSAVAVSKALVSFALGTDTAGSGRIPAAFNQLIGIKPSKGLLSISGLLPACRSLDCISVFCLNPDDAGLIMSLLCKQDPDDPFTLRDEAKRELIAQDFLHRKTCDTFEFGIPQNNQLEFFGNTDYQRRFNQAIAKLQNLGGRAKIIDFSSFQEAGALLYDGPWVTERYLVLKEIFDSNADLLLPVTRNIIEKGKNYSAADVFSAMYRLQELKVRADKELDSVEFIVTPTAGTCYTTAAVAEDPLSLNSNLGYYTNFMNLLDYAAIAIPADEARDSLPFGISLLGPALSDAKLLAFADTILGRTSMPFGASGYQWQNNNLQPAGNVDFRKTVKV